MLKANYYTIGEAKQQTTSQMFCFRSQQFQNKTFKMPRLQDFERVEKLETEALSKNWSTGWGIQMRVDLILDHLL